jgi:uncharacterized protein with PhoU and TrkA domain
LLLATQSAEGDYVYNPADEERLAPGMILIVMGDPRDVRALNAVCHGPTVSVPASAPVASV